MKNDKLMIEGYRLILNDWYISCKYLNGEHIKMIICDLMIESYKLLPNVRCINSKCHNNE